MNEKLCLIIVFLFMRGVSISKIGILTGWGTAKVRDRVKYSGSLFLKHVGDPLAENMISPNSFLRDAIRMHEEKFWPFYFERPSSRSEENTVRRIFYRSGLVDDSNKAWSKIGGPIADEGPFSDEEIKQWVSFHQKDLRRRWSSGCGIDWLDSVASMALGLKVGECDRLGMAVRLLEENGYEVIRRDQ